jgi:hypothetical protein
MGSISAVIQLMGGRRLKDPTFSELSAMKTDWRAVKKKNY